MRKPAGVIVAAVILAIIALLGLFGSIVAIAATMLVHNPIVRNAPEVRAAGAAAMALLLIFFAWCAWTTIGLLRMRPWARISTVIVGGIIFVFCAIGGVGLLLARGFAPAIPLGATGIQAQTLILEVAGFYFLASLIGLWWLVYFNLASVRAAFATRPTTRPLTAPSPVAQKPVAQNPLVPKE